MRWKPARPRKPRPHELTEKLAAYGTVKPEDIGKLTSVGDKPTNKQLADFINSAVAHRVGLATRDTQTTLSEVSPSLETVTAERDKARSAVHDNNFERAVGTAANLERI